MPVVPTTCPSPEALTGFDRGLLPDEELVRVAAHLDDCPACRDRLADVPRTPDALVAAVRRYIRPSDPIPPFPSPSAPTADFPAAPADTDAGGNTDAPAAALALAAQLRERWGRGERPAAEEYLAADPGLAADPEAVLELVVAEAVAREAAGEPAGASAYQARFPAHAAAIARQFRVLRALAQGSSGGHARPPARGADADVPAGLLAPPQEPGELGRLGRYRVLRVIGRGGMGLVFEAYDPHLARPIALKVILPDRAGDERARQRFLREARAAAGVEHDHVVPVYDTHEDRGVLFIAMPLLRGESLQDRLGRGPRLPVTEVLRIGREVADGLAAAHEKELVHRDVKPGNLWLEAPKGRVKILDFGLARGLGDEGQLTRTGGVVGTPAYMAPEQAGAGEVDSRADLFALGVILYQMTTGKTPFRGDGTLAVLAAVRTVVPPPPRDLDPHIPQRLSDLIMLLLEKNPAFRPRTAREVVAVIAAIEDQLQAEATLSAPLPVPTPIQTSPPDKSPPPPRASRRSRWAVAVLAVTATVGVGMLAAAVADRIITRVETADGEILIATDDPSLVVTVKKDGVVIEDTSQKRVFRVVPGRYWVEVTNPATGERYLAREFTITRNGKETLKVVIPPKPAPPAVPPVAPDPGPPSRPTPTGVVTEAPPRDAADEVVRVRLTAGRVPATAAAFSPGGKFLAVGWDDGSATVLDAETHKPRYHIPLNPSDNPGRVADLAFGPADDLLATASTSGLIRLLDLDTGKPRVAIHHSKGFKRAAFSPNGKWVATSDNLGYVHIWSATADLTRVGHGEGGEPHVFAWVENRLLVLRERDNVPMIWDLIGGEATRHYRSVGDAPPGAKAFLPGGKQLLVAESRNNRSASRLRVVALEVAKEPLGMKPGPAWEEWGVDLADPVNVVGVSKDGRWACAATRPAEKKGAPPAPALVLFDLQRREEVHRFTGHAGVVEAVTVSADGRLIVSASADGTARVWKVPPAREKR